MREGPAPNAGEPGIPWWRRENVAALLLFLLLAAIAIFWRGQPIPFIYQAF